MHSQRAGEGEECPAASRALRSLAAGAVLVAAIAAAPLAPRAQTVPGDANCAGTPDGADGDELGREGPTALSRSATGELHGDGRLTEPAYISLKPIVLLPPSAK